MQIFYQTYATNQPLLILIERLKLYLLQSRVSKRLSMESSLKKITSIFKTPTLEWQSACSARLELLM